MPLFYVLTDGGFKLTNKLCGQNLNIRHFGCSIFCPSHSWPKGCR